MNILFTDLQSSDKVSVYTDASQNCRRGNTQMPAENAVFVGNGCALMSRRDLFSDQSKNRYMQFSMSGFKN